MKRLFFLGLFLSLLAPLFAFAQTETPAVDPALFQDMKYRNVGPARGGRVTAVAGHAAQPTTFYFGSTGGGVWKTTDNGQNWRNISDGFFETASIGAIRVADTDPDVMYVGTGSDGLRSNVITGRGVYKSTNGGKTWDFKGLRNVGQIGAVLIHPTNPDLVYIAAIGQAFAPNPERGVYRSTDGGDSWEKILFVSDSTGATDLEFAPDNPNEIYASMWRAERKPWTIISGGYEGGVYKSTDGGDSWMPLTHGLPQGLRGKSDLAVSPADPNRVYVLMEAPEDKGEGGVYRSDDRGATWRLISTERYLLDRPFYYTNIDADPTNADVLYVNATGYFKSTDGGASWQRRRTPHGDNHDMWINPNNPNVFIQANDGGVNVTLDGGRTWSPQDNQPTAEIYQVAVDDQFPYWLYGGQQDNSTIALPSLPPYSVPSGPDGYWRSIGGCETGPVIPKPGDSDIVYANCKGRFGRYNKRTGQEKQYYVGAANMYGQNPRDLKFRFQRVVPIEISPHNPDVIYHGSQFVHRTTDEGVTWDIISPDLTAFTPETQVISGAPITRDITGEEHYSAIYVIEESPLEQGVIWTGANDGPVYITRDGGANWTHVTPPDLPPQGRIQTIDPSPHTPGKAYIAAYRYLLGDWEPYIFRTTDYGQTWTRLTDGTNGIPVDTPTRVIREDPERAGLLYAGTEFGMYVSFDDGAEWQSLQLNLPVTPITDIEIFRKDLILSTMGRSFWILDNLTPLHQLENQAMSNPHLYTPRDTYRMRYFGRSSTGVSYLPVGAMIDFYLPENQEVVTLEILDAQGDVVAQYSSATPPAQMVLPEQPSMREFRLERIGGPRVPKTAGHHRFMWNLTHPGAWSPDPRRSGMGGPMVLPDTYHVRITAGDWQATQPVTVHLDPRVETDGVTSADLTEQLALSLQVRDAISEGRMAQQHIAKFEDQLAQREGDSTREITRKLAAIKTQLVTAPGRYQEPRLLSQLGYLYGMLNRADQKPGRDAHMRYTELRTALDQQLAALQALMETPIGGGGR